jgi:hypothetical protein
MPSYRNERGAKSSSTRTTRAALRDPDLCGEDTSAAATAVVAVWR